jgi:hypothetical protein
MLTETDLTLAPNAAELFREITSGRWKAESVCPSEWILHELSDPKTTLTIFVAPGGAGEIQTACSCDRGTRDQPCPHALLVIAKIRSDKRLEAQLFKERHGPRAA